MASKSRVAQKKLEELEKGASPFDDQLAEAVKFIGGKLKNQYRIETKHSSDSAAGHGREEYILRWLLKNFQSKDDVPRRTALSWHLFSHLLQAIPLTTAARILQERKFMLILRQTLEEVQKTASDVAQGVSEITPGSALGEVLSSKVSKKRNHSGELVASDTVTISGQGLIDLVEAIYGAVHGMILSTDVIRNSGDQGRSAAFSAEYMSSVMRTTAEEAAKILGAWLSLSCLRPGQSDLRDRSGGRWVSQFAKIWETRIAATEDLMQFSLHCSPSVLSLLRAIRSRDIESEELVPELEQLIAQNIMIPAKAAKGNDVDSDLLSTLTRVLVAQDSANAPLLFEVAIRSIQPHGSQRRRSQDDVWLQVVFATLREAMLPQRSEQNIKAIRSMLQSAIAHKVSFELPILRSVTSAYALTGTSANWELLNTIIILDANVFLIPYEEEDLLKLLLTQITIVSVDPSWPEYSSQIISDVVVLLMREFANARDLSGFIRHWYTQLVEFEKVREDRDPPMMIFGAWEDDKVHHELSKLFVSSLTVHQISEILDFLDEEVANHPDAVCVVLEAIAGSVSFKDTEVVDAVQTRLYHIMFDDESSEKLKTRYKWRSWRILSLTLSWLTKPGLEEISKLWEERAPPFSALSGRIGVGGLLEIGDEDLVELEILEFFRCGCAAWKRTEECFSLESFAKASMLDLLQCLARDVKSFTRDLMSAQKLGREVCGTNLNTQYRGIGWMVWSYVRCVFVEYPESLVLGLQLPGNIFKEMLQNVFWIASASLPGVSSTNANSWLNMNNDAFPDLWVSALLCLDSKTGNRSTIRDRMIDIMLGSENNYKNPLIKAPSTNIFAIQCLSKLPLDAFSKKLRERIMKSWLSVPEKNTQQRKKKAGPTGPEQDAPCPLHGLTAFNCEVLSLKVKIMRLATLYEGMNYKDLSELADAMSHPEASLENIQVNLAEFKKLAELTLSHVIANLDQSQNQEYLQDAMVHVKKSTSFANWDSATVALSEVILTTLSAKEAKLNKREIISSSDLEDTIQKFKNSLLVQLKSLLELGIKSAKSIREGRKDLILFSTIDALSVLGVDEIKLAELADDAKSFILSLDKENNGLSIRLGTFMAAHTREADGKLLNTEVAGNTSSIYGRRAIIQKTSAIISSMNQPDKLALLKLIFGEESIGLSQLDKLLALRLLIIACEDTRRSLEENEDSDDDDEEPFDLSTAFSTLCSQSWKATSFRQFCLINETMELMLRTKNRSMSQWNIDSTLGSITIVCSRNGPSLCPSRAGFIYLHLCHLLRAVLINHRLKLQGHFHLVVQCLQALLRCLYIPLPHTTTKFAKLFVSPPWLSSPNHQLKGIHATAFTRLVTLICDPSVSSVARSHQSNLTSATDKAKRIAGQHMHFVLSTYIKLQLEMRMLPEVREKMVPGLYAIFDTTTPEMRRMISDGLDASGRAVFGTLYKDYLRFGKWKGS